MTQQTYINTPLGPARLTGETECKGEKIERKEGILMFPELWGYSNINPYLWKQDIHTPPTESSLKCRISQLRPEQLQSILGVSQDEWTDTADMREKAYIRIQGEIDKCTEEHQRKTNDTRTNTTGN